MHIIKANIDGSDGERTQNIISGTRKIGWQKQYFEQGTDTDIKSQMCSVDRLGPHDASPDSLIATSCGARVKTNMGRLRRVPCDLFTYGDYV